MISRKVHLIIKKVFHGEMPFGRISFFDAKECLNLNIIIFFNVKIKYEIH